MVKSLQGTDVQEGQVYRLPGMYSMYEVRIRSYRIMVIVIDVEREADVFSKLKPHQFTPEGKLKVISLYVLYL